MIGSVNRNLVSVGSVLGSPSTDISRPVHAAVLAIDRVHKVPELAHRVPVVSDSAMAEGAKYRWDKATRRPVDIRLNPRGDHVDLSTVLEVGHLLDHQAIGIPGEFASAAHPRLAEWRIVTDSTRAVQKLEDLRETGSIPYRFSDGIVRQARVREIANDLLDPWELFSRSYAQFISEDSGSAKLAAQIQGFRNPENPGSVIPQFWNKDDFGDVSGGPQKSYNQIGMEEMSLTREQEIEAAMGIFGGDRMTAEALVARLHGESAGTCVAVDRHGKEIPASVAIREKKPPRRVA
jgi:hypothetical protein